VLFGARARACGVAAQTFTTTANGRSASAPIRDAAASWQSSWPSALGGTPIGAPFVGWVADTFGPRWALGVGAAAGSGGEGLCGYANKHERGTEQHVALARAQLPLGLHRTAPRPSATSTCAVFARRADSSAPATEPTAIVEVSRP